PPHLSCPRQTPPPAPPPPPAVPAPPYCAHARTAAPGGHLAAFLPQCHLRLSGLGGLGQLVRQRASEWWPLAAMLLHGLRGLFSGDARHASPWQARRARPASVGRGRVGGRLGHPRRGPCLRGRPQ